MTAAAVEVPEEEYPYRWFLRLPAGRSGQRCRVVGGKFGELLTVEFADGTRLRCRRGAIKKVRTRRVD